MHVRILQCLEANGPQPALDVFETFKRDKPYKTDDLDVVAAWLQTPLDRDLVTFDGGFYSLTVRGYKLFKPVTIPAKIDRSEPCEIAKHPGVNATRSFAETQSQDPDNFDLLEGF